jgi:hypothetical protein
MGEFTNTIFEPGDWIELRALKGGSAQKLWSKAFEVQALAGRLKSLNEEAFNIYFGPNPRKAAGVSGDDSVDLCRCIFVDFDGIGAANKSGIVMAKIMQAGLPRPTIAVSSGHGVHCYWRLNSPLEPGLWSELQARLNVTVGSDTSIKNPERLMRLPGFLNCKSEPFVKCEIIYVEPSLIYNIEDIEHKLCELLPKDEPQPAQPAKRPARMEHKARAMLYASKWEGIIEGQGRNNAAYKHSCQLRRDFDLPDNEAWLILSDWNRANNPPLSDAELRQAFDSSTKYGKHQVGTKLNEPVRQQSRQDPLKEFDEYIDGVATGRLRTIDWPWHYLSEGTQALQPATVTILSGGPGAAKSLFTMQAVRFWLDRGEQVRYYGMEGVRAKYMARYLSQITGVSELTKTSYIMQNHEAVLKWRKEHERALSRFSESLCVAGDVKADYLVQISAWAESEAKKGTRVIIVDPITLALRNSKPWVADQRFVRELMNIARRYLCNVIIVTHPEKGVDDPSLQNLAGGASYGRFSDNVFTIKKHDDKTGTVITPAGRCQTQYNQTVTIAKARDGSLVGCRLAYEFNTESLCTSEIGIVTKS